MAEVALLESEYLKTMERNKKNCTYLGVHIDNHVVAPVCHCGGIELESLGVIGEMEVYTSALPPAGHATLSATLEPIESKTYEYMPTLTLTTWLNLYYYF